MEPICADIASQIRVASSSIPNQRLLVAIAGPPGSGKSTIAARVVQILNSSKGTPTDSTSLILPADHNETVLAVAISMDGFHLTRRQLDSLADPTKAYARRGAPWTFDVNGVLTFVRSLRKSASIPMQGRPVVLAPSFDHAVKDPVENDISILPEASIVIIEGNYLLLDENDWRDISKLVDFRIFVDVDADSARKRVASRHVQAGIERTLENGMRRFDANDGLNGDLIRRKLVDCDLVVRSVDVIQQ